MRSILRWPCAMIVVIGAALAGINTASGQVCVTDAFTYADGGLGGQGGWTGTTAGRVDVVSGEVVVTGGSPDSTATLSVTCPACEDGTITAVIRARGTASTTTLYSVYFDDAAGLNFARWNTSGANARGRVLNTVTGTVALSTTSLDELKVVIDTVAKTSTFYLNGTLMPGSNPLSFAGTGAGNTLGRIRIVSENNAAAVGQQIFFDDLSITLCEGNCSSDVTPRDVQNAYAAVGASTTLPPVRTYTVENNNTLTINQYTVAETDMVGAPADYPWLSLSKLTGGPLAPSATDTVDAIFDPSLLSAGLHTGFIQFADDCVPAGTKVRPLQLIVGSGPCYADAFPYQDGSLAGNASDGLDWVGHAKAAHVENGMAFINADDQDALSPNSIDVTQDGIGCGPCEDGTITVVTRLFYPGTNGPGGNLWTMSIGDTTGHSLAQWQGQCAPGIRTRIAGSAVAIFPGGGANTPITPDVWHELKVVIDTVNDMSHFFVDGQPFSSLSHGVDVSDIRAAQTGVGDAVGSITISQFDWRADAEFHGKVFFDDLQVLGCTGECVGLVTPGRDGLNYTPLPFASGAGAAVEPLTNEFTFTNDGLVSIANYTVQEVDSAGTPTDYPWFTLNPTSGGPLAPWTPDEPITATYDSTGLAAGPHIGFVKFTDSCDPAQTFTRSIKLNVGDCLAEPFDNYPNGDLSDAPGWQPAAAPVGGGSGWGTTRPIQVENGVLKITGATPASPGGVGRYVVEHRRIDNCGDCAADGIWTVRFKIRGHDGGNRFWEIHATPLGGQDLAGWRGMGNAIEPLVDGFAGFATDLTGGGVFDEIEARINVHDFELEGIPALSTRFLFNGAILDTIDFNPGLVDARIRRLTIVRMDNDVTGDVDPVVEIDDLVVTPCAPVCGEPVFDSNGDGEVDSGDLQTFNDDGFIDCATGPSPATAVFDALSFKCKCLDTNSDKAIDQSDFAVFQRCISSGTPEADADPSCDD